MKLGVVTVTYNSADVLPGFLRSFQVQDTPSVLYVIDNASKDSTREQLAELTPSSACIRVILNDENVGIAVGNNQGIAAAIADGCELVLLINNDTEFGPTVFRQMEESLASNTADILVPSIRYFDRPDTVWRDRSRFSALKGHVPEALTPQYEGTHRLACSSTCVALVTVDLFQRIGLMDEAYFVYFDDTDFFRRAFVQEATMMLDTSIVVLHKVSSLTSREGGAFTQQQMIQNRIYYVRSHSNGIRRLVGVGAACASAVKNVVQAKGGRYSRFLLMVRAIRAGFRMQAKIAAAPST